MLILKGNRKKFTLLELLIVIAIIAILFSMAYPYYLKATKSAKEVYCKSSMRQWHVALTHQVLMAQDVKNSGVVQRERRHFYSSINLFNEKIVRFWADDGKINEAEEARIKSYMCPEAKALGVGNHFGINKAFLGLNVNKVRSAERIAVMGEQRWVGGIGKPLAEQKNTAVNLDFRRHSRASVNLVSWAGSVAGMKKAAIKNVYTPLNLWDSDAFKQGL